MRLARLTWQHRQAVIEQPPLQHPLGPDHALCPPRTDACEPAAGVRLGQAMIVASLLLLVLWVLS
jgi:hypothetical protein